MCDGIGQKIRVTPEDYPYKPNMKKRSGTKIL